MTRQHDSLVSGETDIKPSLWINDDLLNSVFLLTLFLSKQRSFFSLRLLLCYVLIMLLLNLYIILIFHLSFHLVLIYFQLTNLTHMFFE